jgi:hypothetical protein
MAMLNNQYIPYITISYIPYIIYPTYSYFACKMSLQNDQCLTEHSQGFAVQGSIRANLEQFGTLDFGPALSGNLT